MNTLSRCAGNRHVGTAAVVVMLIAAIAAPAAAHHGNHSLSGKGTMTVSGATTCGSDDCYMVSLDFPANGGSNAISVAATGQGMTDPSTCKDKSGASCCVATMTLSLTFDQSGNPIAGIDCAFAGTECDKPTSSPTTATFKGKLECMDGTGQLAGKSASGKLSGKVTTGTGEGPASASLHLN
jgi:hypothetical protein